MISHSYRNHAIEQRGQELYVPALGQVFSDEALAHAAIDRNIEIGEAIIRDNERQSEYWQRVGGRDESITGAVGWDERYQRVLGEAPK